MNNGKGKGVFICIEGLDGSGKTTQAKNLVGSLRQRGFDAVYTTEPSIGRVGELIRRFVLDREKRMPIALEALLFAADRIDHLETEVKPLLKQGKIVVCDRYVYSTIAYQGAGGLDLNWIRNVNKFAEKPDLALFIDVPPEVVVNRLKRKKTVMETLVNQQRVREVYVQMVSENQLKIVEGNESKEKVSARILAIVQSFLKKVAPGQ